MKRLTASALVAMLAVATVPAAAQYANEFSPAKLIKQGKTTVPIAGTGTVIVQVQVNADGTHKVIKVIKSTNPGDNDAAMDIAQNSTYRPAHKGSTPSTAFYDFTLKFNGKSVQAADDTGGAGGSVSPQAQKIANMIRAKQYAQAKSAAQMALLSSPGDDTLRQMLGIAAYDSNDVTTAAAAFDKVANIGKDFKPIAAASLASAAVQVAQTNPAQSLSYAQKAVALEPNTNSRFALGVAQLANKQNADALATLKGVHDAAMADPKFNTTARVNIDAQLMAAYQANGDTKGVETTSAEIKQLDPNNPAAGRVLGNSELNAGMTAMNAKDTATALKNFDAAGASGDPQIAVTAYSMAAFMLARADKPDYKKVQAYADKALAMNPNSPEANFAEGVALAGQWAQSQDAATKKKAMDALTKADDEAKAAGNDALALQIENFMKTQLNAPGHPGG